MMAGKSFIFRFADVEVREREFSLVKAGEVLPVEPKAFRVLLILLRNPQKLLPKDELLTAVWGDTAVSENSLARSIALLRRLLGDESRDPRFIETVATVGYRWVCKIEVDEDDAGELERTDKPNSMSVGDLAEAPKNGDVADAAAASSRQIDQSAGQSANSGREKGGGGERRWKRLLIGVAILALSLGAAIWYLHGPLWSLIATPTPRVLRLSVSIPASQGFVDTPANAVLVTQDGSAIVYSGRGPHSNRIYYRRLSQLEGTPLPGTDDFCCPAISPSGDWVAFESGGTISKVSVHGGAPITLAKVAYEGGLSWGPDDSIYSAEAEAGLFRIPAQGGPERRIAIPDSAKHGQWFFPLAMPDGKTVLVHAWGKSRGSKLGMVRVADGKFTELEGEGENPIGLVGATCCLGASTAVSA
jgi:DNA-binding winged helix-turn-helix (wHTH) protein